MVEEGAVENFLNALAEDMIFVPDGGGTRGAAIQVLKGKEAVSAFIRGTSRFQPLGLTYTLMSLNGQQAIVARTPDKQLYFAIFIYSDGLQVNLMHVIAGEKLQAL